MTSPSPHASAVWFSVTSLFCLSPSSLRVPLKGQAGDVGCRFPQSVTLTCLVRCHNSSLEIFLGHHTPKIGQWSSLLVSRSKVHKAKATSHWNRRNVSLSTEMSFDLHIGLKTEKAACAFLYLASACSSVPQVVVIRLPRYVRAVTRSKVSPAEPIVCWDQILISLVLACIYLEPDSCGASSFCRMWAIFWLSKTSSKTMSSAKSKSSNFRSRVSWILAHYHQGRDEIPSPTPRERKGGWAGTPVGPQCSCWRVLSYHHHAKPLLGSHRKRPESSSRFSQGSRSALRSSITHPEPQNQKPFQSLQKPDKAHCSIPRSAPR